jgi:hypothetical protein
VRLGTRETHKHKIKSYNKNRGLNFGKERGSLGARGGGYEHREVSVRTPEMIGSMTIKHH